MALESAKGFFFCRRIRDMRRNNQKIMSKVTGKTYEIREFLTCNTTNVIYLSECGCGQKYVGCTKRTLERQEHIRNHSVPEHFRHCHKWTQVHNILSNTESVSQVEGRQPKYVFGSKRGGVDPSTRVPGSKRTECTVDFNI